jgi:GcrA cell cycle regulator
MMDVSASAVLAAKGIHVSGTAWSDGRRIGASMLWKEGYSASQIAKALGRVSRSAVMGKLHRMRLGGRGSPYTPTKKPPRQKKALRAHVFRADEIARRAAAAHAVSAAARADALMATRLPPLQFENGQPRDVLSVRPGECRFGIGDPAQEGFAFCGRATAETHFGSYCADHAKLCYVATRKAKAGDAKLSELKQRERLNRPEYRRSGRAS